MKNIWRIAPVVAVLCLCGCASQGGVNYADKAKEHEFSYFFPRSAFVRNYATIEEAYDYINTAQMKFSATAGKPRAKGLTAKLSPSPSVSGEQPVTVVCFMYAQDTKTGIDLSDPATMEKSIRDSISALFVFMVFYEDRGIAIPGFYLKSGYQYTSANSNPKQFSYNNTTYDAEYPVGWNIDKAFSYLRKEIN
jgi:hypothetical protein